MSKTERSLSIVGWVVPGVPQSKALGRNRSRSRSNSILHQSRGTREVQQPQEVKDESQRRSVTIVEGRQRMLLFVDENLDEDAHQPLQKQVPLEVDEAISGLEG